MDIKYSAVKAPMRGRVHHPVRLGRILVYGVMFLLLTVSLIPLVWVVRTAFIPRELTLDLTAVAWPHWRISGEYWRQRPLENITGIRSLLWWECW